MVQRSFLQLLVEGAPSPCYEGVLRAALEAVDSPADIDAVETEHQLALQLRDLLYPPLGHHYQPRRMHAGTDVEAPPPYELADPAGTMSLTGLARGQRLQQTYGQLAALTRRVTARRTHPRPRPSARTGIPAVRLADGRNLTVRPRQAAR